LSGVLSVVKCNMTRPGLGREGGVTVTGLVTGLSFILYKEEGLFQGSSVLRFLRSSYADSLRVLLAGPTAGVKQLRGVIQLCYKDELLCCGNQYVTAVLSPAAASSHVQPLMMIKFYCLEA
jgi:hypothetical protein